MTHRLAATSVLLLAFCTGISAQTLSISQSTAKPGGAGSLLLKLDTPPASGVVALQWKFVFPRGVTVGAPDIIAGSAAESASKSLTCAPVPQTATPVYACVLAGGKQPQGSGTLATVRYRIAPGVSKISEKVIVQDVIAVTADLKKVTIPNAEGVILVQ